MNATRNLQASLLWARSILGYQPVSFAGGDDPATTSANLVKQTMLGPPFTWPWNRNEVQFAVVPDQQEYVVLVPDYQFTERITLRDGNGVVKPVATNLSAPLESSRQRPVSMGAQIDPGDGALTFRFNTRPDQSYTAVVQYQRRAVPLTSLAATWAPIPDDCGYIYEWGFLGNLALLNKDARAMVFMQRFMAHLLSRQDALDATQRNLFLGNWLPVLQESQRATQSAAQATQLRAT